MVIFQPFGVGQYQSSIGWVIAVAFPRVGAPRDGVRRMNRQGGNLTEPFRTSSCAGPDLGRLFNGPSAAFFGAQTKETRR